MRSCLIILITLCLTHSAVADQPSLQRYETKYYILFTDVSRPQAQEAAVRMSKMAEEYHERTRDFSGVIRTKFPFYLYRHREDYIAAGGMEGSAGLFDGSSLYAVAGEALDDRTWHVVQHEGFHQFAAGVIGGDRPMWIDEGLAEYFGEALFTGDGFISGIIPNWRLKRVRDEIVGGKFLPFDKMMALSNEAWNARLAVANYDHAWSMAHFLGHGDDGKYRKALAGYMVDLSRNKRPDTAWTDNFGSAAGFQERWKAWWLSLPDNPTANLYAQATVARLASFLARAAAQKQTFTSFEKFKESALTKKLKLSDTDWLPPNLLELALADADDLTKAGAVWTLSASAPQLRCTLKDGKRYASSFQLRNAAVVRVETRKELEPQMNTDKHR